MRVELTVIEFPIGRENGEVAGWRVMGSQTRSHDDLVRTAIHEAGHAVVASRLGRLVSRITIVPDAEIGAWGVVGLFEDERFLDADEELAVSEPEAAAWELLAGAAAEVVLLGADPSQRSPRWSFDFEKAERLIGEHELPAIDGMLQHVCEMVLKDTDAVLRVAWSLLRFGSLGDPSMVDALCDASYYPRICVFRSHLITCSDGM